MMNLHQPRESCIQAHSLHSKFIKVMEHYQTIIYFNKKFNYYLSQRNGLNIQFL